jgi:hypothetical protein
VSETNGTPQKPPDAPIDQFKELTRKIVQVPKAEVDVKEAERQRKKAKKKR